ncbi:hypothetical protein C4A75_23965 [Brevibacillus laterosporus]|nr:hypothetical protein [Brevibacillus laterosporus]PPA80986.1 hypothetical protein C4A75_23965 [Brevibacillus laterosporus]
MKKIASKLMIGALSLAVFAPTAAFAATNTNVDETKVEQAFYQKQAYFSLEDRESNQQELMKIINKYNPDLADDFQKLFDQHEKVKVELDEATKKQLDEIREQVKNGTLTQEQANEKLGVKDFDLGKMEKVKFDEAMVKKMDEINEQVKNGTLTQEQANEKLGVKDFGGKENIIEQIKVAADAGDADTVNKLLQEFLEKMQDKKQSIMAAE